MRNSKNVFAVFEIEETACKKPDQENGTKTFWSVTRDNVNHEYNGHDE